jgi:hypothetical protein
MDLLPNEFAALGVEDPYDRNGPGALGVNDPHMNKCRIVGRPIDHPATGRRLLR